MSSSTGSFTSARSFERDHNLISQASERKTAGQSSLHGEKQPRNMHRGIGVLRRVWRRKKHWNACDRSRTKVRSRGANQLPGRKRPGASRVFSSMKRHRKVRSQPTPQVVVPPHGEENNVAEV